MFMKKIRDLIPIDLDILIEGITDDSRQVQNYFELVIIQLKTIEESYGDFIKVERK